MQNLARIITDFLLMVLSYRKSATTERMKKLLIILSIMLFGIYSMPVFAASSTPDISQQTKQLAQWESAGIKNASDPKIKQLYEQLSKQISEYNKLEQEYISQLQENADAMKETEQSTENKLLGGAAIGATGIGAMQLASGAAEQAADEDAEAAMRAYLATFHCNYGGGKNIPGGEQNVQLPAADLLDLRTQYINLANSLKIRKTSLDMRPGIESEVILDSASTGLYDDVAIGKTDGAFTSLSRALTDKTSPDSTEWEQQKSESAKKTKTGGTIAAVGAVGGAIGNLIINKDAPKENSKKIKSEFEKKSRDLASDIYATEKELSTAIEENKKKIAEYNKNLVLHQEFAQTITQAECTEKFREYTDYIAGLKPITDDFANTTDLNIKYDLNEQQTTYTQCVTDALRTECESKSDDNIWENGACVKQNPADAANTPKDENKTIIASICLHPETKEEIETVGDAKICTTSDGKTGRWIAGDTEYCECIQTENSEIKQETCPLINGKGNVVRGAKCQTTLHGITHMGHYDFGLRDTEHCVCIVDKDTLERTECKNDKGKTVTQGDSCTGTIEGKKAYGFFLKKSDNTCVCYATEKTDKLSKCLYNGKKFTVGAKCESTKSIDFSFINGDDKEVTGTTKYDVIGRFNADKNGMCYCNPTQCPAGRILKNGDCTTCDTANGYFQYLDHDCRTKTCPREIYETSWLAKYNGEIGNGQTGAQFLWNESGQFSADKLCEHFCKSDNVPQTKHQSQKQGSYFYLIPNAEKAGTYDTVQCKRSGKYMIDKQTNNCICNPSEEEVTRNREYTPTSTLRPSPTPTFVLTPEMQERAANATYRKTCYGGYTTNNNVCVDVFNNIQVTHLSGQQLAWAYILATYGLESVCKSTFYTYEHDDFLQCTSINGPSTPMYFEFIFDDLKESNDKTIDAGANDAISKIFTQRLYRPYCIYCNGRCIGDDKWLAANLKSRTNASRIANAFGGKIIDRYPDPFYDLSIYHPTRNATNNERNCKFCQKDGTDCYDWTEAFKNEKVIDIQFPKVGGHYGVAYINTTPNVDPFVFYNGIQISAAPQMMDLIHEYLTLKLNMDITSLTCEPPYHVTETIRGNNISDHEINGTSDDVIQCRINNDFTLSFVFDDASEAWEAYSKGGYENMACKAYDGVAGEGNCLGLTETKCETIRNKLNASSSDVYWDPTKNNCVLGNAEFADNLEAGIDLTIMVAGTIATVAVTVATGGTGANVLALTTTALEYASELSIESKITDFIDEANVCINKNNRSEKNTCAKTLLLENIQRMANYQGNMSDGEISQVNGMLEKLAKAIPIDDDFYWDFIVNGVKMGQNQESVWNIDSWEPEHVATTAATVINTVLTIKGLYDLLKGSVQAGRAIKNASEVLKSNAVKHPKWTAITQAAKKGYKDFKEIAKNSLTSGQGLTELYVNEQDYQALYETLGGVYEAVEPAPAFN